MNKRGTLAFLISSHGGPNLTPVERLERRAGRGNACSGERGRLDAIYLLDRKPLPRRPLVPDDVKPRLLGHWGTTPGLNFVYAHCNRLIKRHDVNMLFIAGPGHGGPALLANTYLKGTYSELYPNVGQNEAGIGRLVGLDGSRGGARRRDGLRGIRAGPGNALAAVELLRTHVPELRVRVVNVVDRMTLQSQHEHPHSMSREAGEDIPAIADCQWSSGG
jgi:phosphoketolase